MSDPKPKNSLPATHHFLRCAQQADRNLAKAETITLVVLVLGSVLVSLAQIIVRNIGIFPFPDVDIILRKALLWIGLLGASLATYYSRHFALDAIKQILPKRLRSLVQVTALIVAALVTAILGISTARFVVFELNFDGFGAAMAVLIMPISFTVMTCRLVLNGWQEIAFRSEKSNKVIPQGLSTSRAIFSEDDIVDPDQQGEQTLRDL